MLTSRRMIGDRALATTAGIDAQDTGCLRGAPPACVAANEIPSETQCQAGTRRWRPSQPGLDIRCLSKGSFIETVKIRRHPIRARAPDMFGLSLVDGARAPTGGRPVVRLAVSFSALLVSVLCFFGSLLGVFLGVLFGAQSLRLVLFLGFFMVDDLCEELLHLLGHAGG